MIRSILCSVVAFTIVSTPIVGAEVRTERIQFDAGASSATLTGRVSGDDAIHYTLNARKGQFLTVSLRPDNLSANYNIYIPGKGPGDEALYASAGGGHEYTGQLYVDGDHTITVFLVRAAARRAETANFDLVVQVTDEQQPLPPVDGPDQPVPSNDPWSRVAMEEKAHGPLLERQATLPTELAKNPAAIATAVVTKDLSGLITGTEASFDTMENPSEVTVTVTEGGILDDDLIGVRHLITMARNKNNEWRIVGYRWGELRRKHLR